MHNQPKEKTDVILELSAAAGGLAHEIRNVLSTLRMNLQLLNEDWSDFETKETDATPESLDLARRSRKRVGTLLKESKRLEAILDDFLNFITRRELKLEPADLNLVMADLVEFFRPKTDAALIDLQLIASPQPLPCKLDINLIKQAVLNLLINAQHAMSEGGKLTIKLNPSPDKNTATIDVIDTGPGIPDEQLSRIFEAYFSTKKSGTGLGLTMARQIIHEHGGDIAVKSKQGIGTHFTISLPFVDK